MLSNYSGFKVIDATPKEKDGVPGYEVTYEDGYASWSPSEVFEKAYLKNGNLTFGHAFELMRQGRKLTCSAMSGGYFKLAHDPKDKALCLEFTHQGEHAKNSAVVYMVPTPTLLECEDWTIIE